MKTVYHLHHPNLITVFNAGKTGPYCWIAMEYVQGESLTLVIQRIGTAGMLDWRVALRFAVHVARALDFAHQNHVIHRNISPMNILVRSKDKMALLGDLMLAKALEGDLALNLTGNEIVGDLQFMPPERTIPGQVAVVDERSDLYSFGATLYALLTGRPPFAAETIGETLMQIRGREPVPVRHYHLAVPDLLEGLVLRCLAKRVEQRPGSAAELLANLERVAAFHRVNLT